MAGIDFLPTLETAVLGISLQPQAAQDSQNSFNTSKLQVNIQTIRYKADIDVSWSIFEIYFHYTAPEIR